MRFEPRIICEGFVCECLPLFQRSLAGGQLTAGVHPQSQRHGIVEVCFVELVDDGHTIIPLTYSLAVTDAMR